MFNYLKKKVISYFRLIMIKVSKKINRFLNPSFEEQKSKVELLPTESKLLNLWENIIKFEGSRLMYSQASINSNTTRLIDSGNILLTLEDGGATLGSLISLVDLNEDKKICIEVDLTTTVANLFKISFDEENRKRIKLIESKKRNVLNQSLDEAIQDYHESHLKVS